jgi:hypothetical protein
VIGNVLLHVAPGSNRSPLLVISRRELLKGLAVITVGGVGFGGCALAELFRLNVTRYAVSPGNWPKGLLLRVMVIADIYVCEPWMSLEWVRHRRDRAWRLGSGERLINGWPGLPICPSPF